MTNNKITKSTNTLKKSLDIETYDNSIEFDFAMCHGCYCWC